MTGSRTPDFSKWISSLHCLPGRRPAVAFVANCNLRYGFPAEQPSRERANRVVRELLGPPEHRPDLAEQLHTDREAVRVAAGRKLLELIQLCGVTGPDVGSDVVQ